MKRFARTLISLVLIAATSLVYASGGAWKMGPRGPYYDENDWPEYTPMYWMQEFMDEFTNDDEQIRDWYRYQNQLGTPYGQGWPAYPSANPMMGSMGSGLPGTNPFGSAWSNPMSSGMGSPMSGFPGASPYGVTPYGMDPTGFANPMANPMTNPMSSGMGSPMGGFPGTSPYGTSPYGMGPTGFANPMINPMTNPLANPLSNPFNSRNSLGRGMGNQSWLNRRNTTLRRYPGLNTRRSLRYRRPGTRTPRTNYRRTYRPRYR